MSKLSVKRMKMSICDESATSSSSSEDDVLPMLPETSSGELSTIEESHLEHESESESSSSSTTSNYMSSLLNESISSVSSNGSGHQRKFQSVKSLTNGEASNAQHEPDQRFSSENVTGSSQRYVILQEANEDENYAPGDVMVSQFFKIFHRHLLAFCYLRLMCKQIKVPVLRI